MPTCRYPGCQIRTGESKNPNQRRLEEIIKAKLKMYRIPKDEERKRKWKEALGLVNTNTNIENITVCQLHFTKEDFWLHNKYIKLSDTAVPKDLKNSPATVLVDPSGSYYEISSFTKKLFQNVGRDPLPQEKPDTHELEQHVAEKDVNEQNNNVKPNIIAQNVKQNFVKQYITLEKVEHNIEKQDVEQIIVKPNVTPKNIRQNIVKPNIQAQNVKKNIWRPNILARNVKKDIVKPNVKAVNVKQNIVKPDSIVQNVEQNVIARDIEQSIVKPNVETLTCKQNIVKPDSIAQNVEQSIVKQDVMAQEIDQSIVEPNVSAQVVEQQNLMKQNFIKVQVLQLVSQDQIPGIDFPRSHYTKEEYSSPKRPKTVNTRSTCISPTSLASRFESPTARLYKTQVINLQKKIKLLNAQSRRHKKQITSLKDTINTLKNSERVLQGAPDHMERIGEANKELFERLMAKASSCSEPSGYCEPLKAFAMTLHYFSTKAYSFARLHFNNCLPHPETIAKWYKGIDKYDFATNTFNALKQQMGISEGPTVEESVKEEEEVEV